VALGVSLAWRRVGRAALGLLAIAGAAVGSGALLIQSRAGPGDYAITMGALALLAPLHARVLLGPPTGHGRD